MLLRLTDRHNHHHFRILVGIGAWTYNQINKEALFVLEELMEMGVPAIVMDPHYEMDFTNNSEISNKDLPLPEPQKTPM